MPYIGKQGRAKGQQEAFALQTLREVIRESWHTAQCWQGRPLIYTQRMAHTQLCAVTCLITGIDMVGCTDHAVPKMVLV